MRRSSGGIEAGDRRGGLSVPAPAPGEHREDDSAAEHAHDGEQPREQVEALLRGGSQDLRPVLGDEHVLDLALRVACRDPLRDERLDLAGSRRARLVERRVADGAHDLAFEVGERRARLDLGRKCLEPPAVAINGLLLDLALRVAGRDQAPDVADDLAGRARVRPVERRQAILAPELGLDLGRGRMSTRRRAPAGRPRGPGGRELRRAESSRRERLLDRALELFRARLAEDVAVDPSRARDDERARDRQPAVVVEDAAGRVAHVRIADAVTREEGTSIAGEIVRVDADEGDAPSIALEGRLEARGLALTRIAPRGPEVDDDDLPAQRRETEGAPGRSAAPG